MALAGCKFAAWVIPLPRRPPTSQAEQERRKAFGVKYGAVMAQIKRDREKEGT